MAQRIIVKDLLEDKEKIVSSIQEVVKFMVMQTQCLLIRSRLSTQEYVKLETLESVSDEIVLLNRFKVTSENGA